MKSLVFAAITALGAMSLQPARPALQLAGAIPLPGVDGRLDHLSVDVASKRLFVAAIGNNSLEVVDLAARKTIKSVPGFRAPQGVLFEQGHIVAANGGSGRVVFLDGSTFAPTTAVQLGQDPYDVRYDAAAGRVYVGSGSALTVLDAEGHTVGTVKLKGHPEGFLLESSGPRVFVNVPSAQQIAVVDREKRAVIATWPAAAGENVPMALDEVHHRLFIGCRAPARLLVYDTTSGRFVVGMQVVGDAADLSYDPARKRLYVSGGEGEITVVEQADADQYRVIQRLKTASDARTSLFVPELNQLFLAVPHHGGQQAEIRIYSPSD